MDFLSLVVIFLLLSVPSIVYYLYWSIKAAEAGAARKKEVLENLKKAYFFNGITLFVIPVLLYRFLDEHLLFKYPAVSDMVLKFLLLAVVIFEIINVFSFEYFDKQSLFEKEKL